MDRIQAIEDRIEIEELMHRYARMVDERDWKRMDEVFAPDATIDYRSTGGQAGPYRETLAWLARALEPWPLNLHFITNLSIELDGDRARSRCYFHAQHTRRGLPGGANYVVAGIYRDAWTRTPAGWRIHARELTVLWTEGNAAVVGRVPEGP